MRRDIFDKLAFLKKIAIYLFYGKNASVYFFFKFYYNNVNDLFIKLLDYVIFGFISYLKINLNSLPTDDLARL